MQKALTGVQLGNDEHFRMGMLHLENDPVLASLFKAHGTLDFQPRGDVFESLVESILSQQLAWSAASAIIGRVRDLYPRRVIKPLLLYKTPPSKLRKAGVSPQKVRYLKDLSSRVVKKKLDLKKINSLPDAELIEVLDNVLGIGPWTVQMLLIFTLGRPDVLPVDDLGIRKAIQTLYSLGELPGRKEIEELAINWHPYCSIASLYLWRSRDAQK